MTAFHLHLVSDATGETVNWVAKAALVQFETAEPTYHVWTMVRSRAQLQRVLDSLEQVGGFVLFTMVDHRLREMLQQGCRRLQIPCVPVLDPVIAALASFLGSESREQPGRQHAMDADYFDRIDAVQFSMAHDDGQGAESLEGADVVLIGVSRTSKTPTCIYLAQRGIKAANVPIVPGVSDLSHLAALQRPMVIGLTASPTRLVQIRRNRLLALNQTTQTEYADANAVEEEVVYARRLFAQHGWPMIDVSRRSIEETAAAILELYNRKVAGESET
ncbi:MAG: pyruvate, water dikinase regulatory protein [Alphaproteobacteria bacterium]